MKDGHNQVAALELHPGCGLLNPGQIVWRLRQETEHRSSCSTETELVLTPLGS